MLTNDILKIRNKKLRGSITVESAFSFTITIFVLFLMLGPLLIIKTTSDIMISLNDASKLRSNYEMVKNEVKDLEIWKNIDEYGTENSNISENINRVEDIIDYGKTLIDFNDKFDETKSEYRNVKFVYSLNDKVYDEETGIINYDFLINFKVPYNLLFVRDLQKRILNYRRAFIGSVGNRFNQREESGDYVYIANNSVNSSVYHTDFYCSYLIKNTYSFEYSNLSSQRNEENKRYTKCDYCFKKIKLKSETICFATKYGERFHYRSNCPMMTAYVTKIPIENVEKYNLRLCPRCNRNSEE